MAAGLALGMILVGCQGAPKSEDKPADADKSKAGASAKDEAPAKAAPAAAKAAKQTCRLTSFAFIAQTRVKGKRVKKHKTITFTYDDKGRVATSVGTEKESDAKEVATYSYDEKGRLLSCEIPKSKANQGKGLKATFVYADDGKLTKITGAGALSTRSFEYGDKGRIAKQVTYFGGNPVSTAVFEYDSAGAPVKVSMLGAKGKMHMGFELTYDDKINPLAGMVFANPIGLFAGHPIGVYGHNIVGRKTLGSKGPGAGKPYVINYTYNDSGYPVSMAEVNKGEDGLSTMEYDCN